MISLRLRFDVGGKGMMVSVKRWSEGDEGEGRGRDHLWCENHRILHYDEGNVRRDKGC